MLDLAEVPWAKKVCRGGNLSFPQEEWELKDWICTHIQQGYVVSHGTISMKAKLMINNETFHASAGWVMHTLTPCWFYILYANYTKVYMVIGGINIIYDKETKIRFECQSTEKKMTSPHPFIVKVSHTQWLLLNKQYVNQIDQSNRYKKQHSHSSI